MFAVERVDLPYVDMCFGIVGQILPADHGYGLYSRDRPHLPSTPSTNLARYPDSDGNSRQTRQDLPYR